MDLTLLLGVGGAGKGFTVENLTQPVEVVEIDCVRTYVLESMDRAILTNHSRRLSRGWEDRWEIWQLLADDPKVWINLKGHFIDAIVKLFPRALLARSVVAEGGLLALEPFRRMFIEALDEVTNIERPFYAWLDPSEETILKNRKERGRATDLKATLATVQGEKAHYEQHAIMSGAHRYTDSAEVINAIDSFHEAH